MKKVFYSITVVMLMYCHASEQAFDANDIEKMLSDYKYAVDHGNDAEVESLRHTAQVAAQVGASKAIQMNAAILLQEMDTYDNDHESIVDALVFGKKRSPSVDPLLSTDDPIVSEDKPELSYEQQIESIQESEIFTRQGRLTEKTEELLQGIGAECSNAPERYVLLMNSFMKKADSAIADIMNNDDALSINYAESMVTFVDYAKKTATFNTLRDRGVQGRIKVWLSDKARVARVFVSNIMHRTATDYIGSAQKLLEDGTASIVESAEIMIDENPGSTKNDITRLLVQESLPLIEEVGLLLSRIHGTGFSMMASYKVAGKMITYNDEDRVKILIKSLLTLPDSIVETLKKDNPAMPQYADIIYDKNAIDVAIKEAIVKVVVGKLQGTSYYKDCMGMLNNAIKELAESQKPTTDLTTDADVVPTADEKDLVTEWSSKILSTKMYSKDFVLSAEGRNLIKSLTTTVLPENVRAYMTIVNLLYDHAQRNAGASDAVEEALREGISLNRAPWYRRVSSWLKAQWTVSSLEYRAALGLARKDYFGAAQGIISAERNAVALQVDLMQKQAHMQGKKLSQEQIKDIVMQHVTVLTKQVGALVNREVSDTHLGTALYNDKDRPAVSYQAKMKALMLDCLALAQGINTIDDTTFQELQREIQQNFMADVIAPLPFQIQKVFNQGLIKTLPSRSNVIVLTREGSNPLVSDPTISIKEHGVLATVVAGARSLVTGVSTFVRTKVRPGVRTAWYKFIGKNTSDENEEQREQQEQQNSRVNNQDVDSESPAPEMPEE